MKIQAVALCALLLAVAACSSSPGSGGGAVVVSPNGVNATTSAGVVSASDKPLDVMTKATRAQLDAKSYRANIKNTSSNGSTNTLLVEYAAPDHYHMVTHSQAGGRDTSLEYVIVGKDTFMKMNGGEWKRFPVDMSKMISAFRDPKFIEELAKTADVKFVSADTVDGSPMLVYEYTMNNAMGMNIKSHAKTWVAVADGLPRKSESESEYGGVKTKTEMTMSDYNSDIKIESPIK
jgi:acyl CoA:acetate/3-ketoacid CoA transferase alpha subunit